MKLVRPYLPLSTHIDNHWSSCSLPRFDLSIHIRTSASQTSSPISAIVLESHSGRRLVGVVILGLVLLTTLACSSVAEIQVCVQYLYFM